MTLTKVDHATIRGREFRSGDEFKVSGLEGVFRFKHHVTNARGESWIDAYGPLGRGSAKSRSFEVSRVKVDGATEVGEDDPAHERWHGKGEPAWPAWVQGFREVQLEAVNQILDAYARGVDVVLLDAPTGTGKTLIAEMVRRALGVDGLYICTTKSLQEQMLRDFAYARVLKGRGNYATELFRSYTCADCGGAKCHWCTTRESCPYQIAKESAAAAKIAVLNTAYLLAEANGAKSTFGKNAFVIADECDVLEDALMGYVEFRVSEKQARDLGVSLPVKSARVKTVKNWLEKELPDAIRVARGGIVGDGVEEIRERMKLARLLAASTRVARSMGDEEWGDWVREYEEDRDTFILKPVMVDREAPRLLWSHGDRWLCMSASIGSPEVFVEGLGLEEARLSWEVVSVPMSFAVENRLIEYRPIADLSYNAMNDQVPVAIAGLKEILDSNREENILVHTVSYGLTKWVERELRGARELHGRRLWSYTNAREREATMTKFRKLGGVICAPSMDRGVDLADELCRVNVVVKCPFPGLKARQTSERMRRDGGQLWYANKVAGNLVQMTGRATRNETDWSRSFILDQNFGVWLADWGNALLPKWWLEALV